MNSKKKNVLIFIILFMITNLIFLPWLIKGHMYTDAYKISDMGYQTYAREYFLLDGRFISAVLTNLMDALKVPIQTYTIISLEIALVVSCITIMVIIKTIEKWKTPKSLWSEIILIIASYYTIFNFLYIENLHFIECGSMVISLLMFVLAARQVVEKNRYWTGKALLFLCIGLMCYQGTISMFVITLFVFSMCKGNSAKQVMKDFMQGMVLALGGILINQLSIKVVEQICHLKQTRDINLSVMGNNIVFILSNVFSILKYTGHLIPQYSFLIVLSIMEVLITFKIVRQNRKKQDKKNENIILEQLAIIGIGIVAGFFVSIINIAAFWSGRIRFSIGALIGFLWIHLWVKTDFTDKKERINILLIICLIIYGFLNSLHYITAIIDHQKLNELVKEEVLAMQKDVIQYEEEKQIKVTKIAVIVKKRETTKSFYSHLRCYGNLMMASGIRTQWSAVGCYNYYTNSKLGIHEPTETEMKEFLEKNKEYLCVDDTLYITTYMH